MRTWHVLPDMEAEHRPGRSWRVTMPGRSSRAGSVRSPGWLVSRSPQLASRSTASPGWPSIRGGAYWLRQSNLAIVPTRRLRRFAGAHHDLRFRGQELSPTRSSSTCSAGSSPGVGVNDWVHHLGKETEEHLVRATRELEAPVTPCSPSSSGGGRHPSTWTRRGLGKDAADVPCVAGGRDDSGDSESCDPIAWGYR